MLHTALVRHPFSGVDVGLAGEVSLPIPDTARKPVAHWYLLTWDEERDGFAFAGELWKSLADAVDDLLSAFEKAVPKRLRKGNSSEATA